MRYRRLLGAMAALALQFVLVQRVTAITHTAVPISGAADAIVHDVENKVFVTTSNGNVQRYDLAAKSLLAPWSAVGVNLRSIDMTADGASLYIADQSAGPTQGVIRKLNAATGTKTNLFYNLSGEGAGAYDIVRLSTNKMMFTANHQFSGGGSPVRFIDLNNDAITVRPSDGVERQTDLFRSADGMRVFMTGGNTSASDIRVYNAPTDSYLVTTNVWTHLNGISATLSPNGSLLAFQGFNVPASIVNSADLSLVDTIPTYRSGLGFSPRVCCSWRTGRRSCSGFTTLRRSRRSVRSRRDLTSIRSSSAASASRGPVRRWCTRMATGCTCTKACPSLSQRRSAFS